MLASGQMGEQSPSSSSAPVCLWNVQTGALVTRFGHRSLRLRALAFSDDERWLACATDNALALWEIATGDLGLWAFAFLTHHNDSRLEQ